MNIQIGKKYIDRVGNIGIIEQYKDFFGKDIKGRMNIQHIDNINFVTKGTVGHTLYPININGKLEDAAKNCPLDVTRKFTLKDSIVLVFSRVVFNISRKLSPNLVKSQFLS